jgi:hypothetical protein
MNKPTSESLKGAAACMKALQTAVKIEQLGFDERETNDWCSVGRYFRDKDSIKAEFLKSACISPSSFQAGFIATLAEYVHYIMSTGEPDVFRWKPETLMTESKVKEKREESLRFEMEEEVSHG